MTRYIRVIALMLALSGCAGTLAKAVNLGNATLDAVETRVQENFEDRKWVRQECRAILDEEVNKERAQGNYAEARKLLRDAYPSLLTEKVVTKIKADVEAGVPIRLPPDICGPGAGAIELPK